jgi:hypothetical protein
MDQKYLKSNTDITLILNYATQISRLCENVILELGLTERHKKDFKFAINCANKVHSVITGITNYEMRKEIHSRTTENYETGVFDNIMHNFGQMSDQQRNLADDVISAILDGTFKIDKEI